MQKLGLIMVTIWITLLIFSPNYAKENNTNQISYQQNIYPLYPATFNSYPDIPSPLKVEEDLEIITGFRKRDSAFTLFSVAVENGDTLNYKKGRRGKGQQLQVDEADFPTLARTGLHSELELDQTHKITGRTIQEITEDGRPERSSFAGFMSHNEDIITVLKNDNYLVRQLGLSHPQLAKPLFNLWNIIQQHDQEMRRQNRPLPGIDWFYYQGRKIHLLDAGSGHGWQESIFHDGLLGMWQFEIRRELDSHEKNLLDERYSHLDEKQMRELIKKLSYIHSGEIVPFYIMRYGFYEGHTSYRADPIAIAFIFGLRSLAEIENAFKGNLYEILTRHFTEERVEK
jgi:hypothetical protein